MKGNAKIITTLNAAGKKYITLVPDIAAIPEAYLDELVPNTDQLIAIRAADDPFLLLKQEATKQGYVLLTYFNNLELYVKEAEYAEICRTSASNLSVRNDQVPVQQESHGGNGEGRGGAIPLKERSRSLHRVCRSLKTRPARAARRTSHGGRRTA